MDDYTVALDPETEMSCTLHLFKNVENCDEVRRRIMNGELPCSIVKASLIVDPLHVLVAANKAALNAKSNQLTTKTVYTEILFCLSTSKNISRSLQEFGIHDDDKNILTVSIHKAGDKELSSKAIINCIRAEKVPISKLSEFTDFELVKKIYKIDENELNVSSINNSVVSRISCKDFASLK